MKKIYIIKDIISGEYYTSIYTYIFSEDIIDADEFNEFEEAERKISTMPDGKYTIETVYIVTD